MIFFSFSQFLVRCYSCPPGKKKGDEERPHKFMTTYPDKRLIYDYVFSREELKWVDWMDTVPPRGLCAAFAAVFLSATRRLLWSGWNQDRDNCFTSSSLFISCVQLASFENQQSTVSEKEPMIG